MRQLSIGLLCSFVHWMEKKLHPVCKANYIVSLALYTGWSSFCQMVVPGRCLTYRLPGCSLPGRQRTLQKTLRARPGGGDLLFAAKLHRHRWTTENIPGSPVQSRGSPIGVGPLWETRRGSHWRLGPERKPMSKVTHVVEYISFWRKLQKVSLQDTTPPPTPPTYLRIFEHCS